MKKKTYTQEQKKQYFAELRARWSAIKSALDQKKIDALQAIIATHGLKCSPYSFAFTAQQMDRQGLDGIPYLDAKTFQGWQENGFQVRKGERSTLSGIVWIGTGSRAEDPDTADRAKENGIKGFMFPKEYRLFHRSQVDPIGAPVEAKPAALRVQTVKNPAPGIMAQTVLDFA